MAFENIVQRVQELAPFEDAEQVKGALIATLHVLRQRLTSDDAHWLAQELPLPLADVLLEESYDSDFAVQEFFERVALHERVRSGIAVERVQVVCRALGESLSNEALTRLKGHLPEYAPLFTPPELTAPPDQATVSRKSESRDNTLAGGRPGGSRPISSSRPGSRRPLSEAHPDRAHTHSVARSSDPHVETKISSARGLTQEREHESLATGKAPGRE
jgi:uncharacterized protein (DUF2267 family)